MKGQKERTELISRRGILTGSAMLLAGGIAGLPVSTNRNGSALRRYRDQEEIHEIKRSLDRGHSTPHSIKS